MPEIPGGVDRATNVADSMGKLLEIFFAKNNRFPRQIGTRDYSATPFCSRGAPAGTWGSAPVLPFPFSIQLGLWR
jgi:hypothetical protein